MQSIITLFEYSQICSDGTLKDERVHHVSPEVFDCLEVFVGEQKAKEEGNKLYDVFRLSSRRGRKTLEAQNYVGTIQAKDTTIEILPKTGRADMSEEGLSKSREMVISMLSELNNPLFKSLGRGSLRVENIPILEIFILIFINEVLNLVKRGLCLDYRNSMGNEKFLKGRLVFSDHVRLNINDRSRFAVEFSEYHLDRPENRLIKSTILYLSRLSRNSENRRKLRIVLNHFVDISSSVDPALDFAACKNDRNLDHYNSILLWCKIFLSGKAPTSFPGYFSADALLFPMEKIFEDYVASKLRLACRRYGISIQVQASEKTLFESSPKKYRLVPDLIAARNERKIILDTKWKLPHEGAPSQSDMYQMFAYAIKYKVDDIILVYPSIDPGLIGFDKTNTYVSNVGDRQITVQSYYFKLPDNNSREKDEADDLAHGIFEKLNSGLNLKLWVREEL